MTTRSIQFEGNAKSILWKAQGTSSRKSSKYCHVIKYTYNKSNEIRGM